MFLISCSMEGKESSDWFFAFDLFTPIEILHPVIILCFTLQICVHMSGRLGRDQLWTGRGRMSERHQTLHWSGHLRQPSRFLSVSLRERLRWSSLFHSADGVWGQVWCRLRQWRQVSSESQMWVQQDFTSAVLRTRFLCFSSSYLALFCSFSSTFAIENGREVTAA